MNGLVKKIHMYCGLLTFSALLVFGIAGLSATFNEAPEGRSQPAGDLTFMPFTAPGGLDDKQVADLVHATLELPLTAPVPGWALRRDRENNLAFDFWTINGISKVTVLEKERRLRVERVRSSLWSYVNGLHATTINSDTPGWHIKLWKYYNEFAIWSLLVMTISGIYLGLSSRPRYRPAAYALALGCALFITLYGITR